MPPENMNAQPESFRGDPSAVARRVTAVTDVVHTSGTFRRFPDVAGDDPQRELEVNFLQTDPVVEQRSAELLVVEIGYCCVIAKRGVRPEEAAETIQKSGSHPGVLFFGAAGFQIRYATSPGPAFDKDELDAFGRINVPLNIVPFWREYLDSSMRRAGLPPVLAPIHRTEPAPQNESSARPT